MNRNIVVNIFKKLKYSWCEYVERVMFVIKGMTSVVGLTAFWTLLPTVIGVCGDLPIKIHIMSMHIKFNLGGKG